MPRSLSEHVARLERDHTGRRRKRARLVWLRYVEVMDFLENCNVANITQATSDEVQFSCPFTGHTQGDNTPSAYMNDGSKDPDLTTLWKCFGCGRQGNAVNFLAEYENVSPQSARGMLKEHYAPGYKAPKYGSIAREFEARYKRAKELHVEPVLKVLDWREAERFEVNWSLRGGMRQLRYMLDRGFTPEALSEWEIGYDYDSERFTIPVFDPDGNLLGFKGRAWRTNARPKYLVLGDKGKRQRYGFQTYDKSLVVFGLDKWGEVERYVLTEGELDVISMWMMGIPAICVGGSSMSTAQAKLIRQYCDEVVLFFDNDVAGKNAVAGLDKADGEHKPGILELLEPHLRVRTVGRHRFDANEYLRRGEAERVARLVAGAKRSIVL